MGRVRAAALAFVALLPLLIATGGTAGARESVRNSDPDLKIVVLGDSTAFTLAWSLNAKSLTSKYHYSLDNLATIGCGIVDGPAVRYEGVVYPPPAECDGQTPAAGTPEDQQPWPVQWRRELARVHPNVVMFLAGRWEVADRVYNGAWTNILDPTFAAYVKSQLELASTIVTQSGAAFVALTAPCADEATQPDGVPWPEADPRRIAVYNELVRQVVAENPTTDSEFNLDALVCPGDKYSATYDGVTIRRPEGVHFTNRAGLALGPALMPTIVAAGQKRLTRLH